jgi:NADH:ubiquinone oxidoreductase subunit 5 (subunit L)/multisubunit Na+/H+ antiporter MnhA subunit
VKLRFAHERGARGLLWALSLVAFVLSHQLIFLATYGGQAAAALLRTGHEANWTVAVASVAVLSVALVVAAMRELWRLSRTARAIGAGLVHVHRAEPVHLAREVARLTLAVFACALLIFVIVENAEHIAAGLPAPGLSVLGSSEYRYTPVVFAFVALAVALVAGLYRWRRDVLLRAIAALRRHWLRGSAAATRSSDLDQWPAGLVDRLTPPGRAPPAAATY